VIHGFTASLAVERATGEPAVGAQPREPAS
jgi:hypothetical protein